MKKHPAPNSGGLTSAAIARHVSAPVARLSRETELAEAVEADELLTGLLESATIDGPAAGRL